jgi:hypothetical protein
MAFVVLILPSKLGWRLHDLSLDAAYLPVQVSSSDSVFMQRMGSDNLALRSDDSERRVFPLDLDTFCVLLPAGAEQAHAAFTLGTAWRCKRNSASLRSTKCSSAHHAVVTCPYQMANLLTDNSPLPLPRHSFLASFQQHVQGLDLSRVADQRPSGSIRETWRTFTVGLSH